MPPKTAAAAKAQAEYQNTNVERNEQYNKANPTTNYATVSGGGGGGPGQAGFSPEVTANYQNFGGGERAPDPYDPYGFTNQLGAAEAAARASEEGWAAMQGYRGQFEQAGRTDQSNLRTGIYSGQFQTDPSQFQTGVERFQRGQGPQFQDSGASSMYNAEYMPQQNAPQFQGYDIGQGPGQFQQGQSPEIRQFQQGQGPHQQMFQADGSPLGNQFQRQQGPELQQFQRGQDAQFTGANQGGFDFDFQRDPGYQHRLDEGQRMIEGSAAARGSLKSGQTLRDLTSFAQGEASQEYGAAYGRARSEFEADRGLGEREAGRRTGFDVGQQQFGQNLDFQAQDRFQGRQQQGGQFGQGLDFQASEAQAGRGMQGYQFDTGTGQQALRDFQSGNRQDFQFGQNLGFQADQAYQGAQMDRFRGDQSMGFGVNRAGAQDWQAMAGLNAQQANMANQFGMQGAQINQGDRQFGANLNQQEVQSYRNLLSSEGQQRNQFNQNAYQFNTGTDQSSMNAFNQGNLAANSQNYNMYNQQGQQSLAAHGMLADRGERATNTFGQGIGQQGDARANAMLGIGNVYGAKAARKSNEKIAKWQVAGQVAGAVAGAVIPKLSDRRLKRNIKKLGKWKEYTKYLYQYIFSDDWYIGVMADEVKKIKPEAVIEREGYYDMVNYGAL